MSYLYYQFSFSESLLVSGRGDEAIKALLLSCLDVLDKSMAISSTSSVVEPRLGHAASLSFPFVSSWYGSECVDSVLSGDFLDISIDFLCIPE